MASETAPFSRFEWMIAWRYMRAKRAEGGVSVMTWISLIGVTLAVFALVATMAVRSGFRAEFVDTIVGANAHITLGQRQLDEVSGRYVTTIAEYDAMAERVRQIDGVTRAAPLVRGDVLASFGNWDTYGSVFGISAENLATIPRVGSPQESAGDIERFEEGVAIGSALARQIGVSVGAQIRLTSPNGSRTPMGTRPRVQTFEVVYIFQTGRYPIDLTRIYMPLDVAQTYFNKVGVADQIEVMVEDPEDMDGLVLPVFEAAGENATLRTWQEFVGDYLNTLKTEDNVMLIIMGILVLVASMNIISGLIMLVKNKGRDIGILRTMGLKEGSILRIFFICGAGIGTVGTILGVIIGCAFAYWIDPIFEVVNYVAGGGVWEASVRGTYSVPAKLELWDVVFAVVLSLALSWTITLFPARRAARMNPVEALRYE